MEMIRPGEYYSYQDQMNDISYFIHRYKSTGSEKDLKIIELLISVIRIHLDACARNSK